jgi:asparagine synthase (glutamine-hydrolysing)
MKDSMKHGGPDGEGIYIDDKLPLALGHRRLSLLDLTSAGHQPMSDINGSLQIVFNGEIYNFLELKKELAALGHIFKTTCDTEVILKSYLQWGKNCFQRFNGMFALAIFDKRTSQLLLARDHAGIKPLYYSIQGGKLFFASEVRAFTSLKPTWNEYEKWKVYFLTFGHLPEPFTTLEGVTLLDKGTVATIDLPTLLIRQEVFCMFSFQSIINTLPEAVIAIREKLSNAVARHLISDAPIGLFLSGGIDSSLLTLLSHKTLQENLHTISIIFEDQKFSEAKYQKLVIDKTGAKHSSCLVTEEEFSNTLPDILMAMDQPSIDGINSYFICKYAHKFGLKAVLSGIGADELFGGYDSFYRTQRIRLFKMLPAFVIGLTRNFSEQRKKKLSFLKRKDFLGDYLFNRGLYTPEETALILGTSVKSINNTLNELTFPGLRKIKIDDKELVSWGEQNLYMQGQLLKDIDYMSMWHGLEVRVPFLDKELVETAHSISPRVKYDLHVKKHLLIKSFADILPSDVYNRKKQGFTFPFEKWIIPVQTTAQRTPDFIKKYEKLRSGKLQWVHYWAYLLACQKEAIKYYNKEFKKVLFLNLSAFRFTGGIEKFNRAFLKALTDFQAEGKLIANCLSVYDYSVDPLYFDKKNYRGFKGNRIKFVFSALKEASKYNTIVLGHINLSLIGWGIKKMFAHKNIILVTHGIEVWDQLKGVKSYVMQNADSVLAVSTFTKEAIVKTHKISPEKITVFSNTIDPYFSYPKEFKKPEYLMKRYGINETDSIIFTLTRLSATEKYKGYDKVIDVLPYLKNCVPHAKYIIAGKADETESLRLLGMQQANDLVDTVLLTGFIKEEEVVDHFLLADVFVMPSRKEGFGIVFIEAMACGLPVIAGNKDGSADALQQGALGQLIDPDSDAEMFQAVVNTLQIEEPIDHIGAKKVLQQKVKKAFGFDTYKQNLEKILVY